MANQAIALQARAPQQGNFLAPAIQQAGQIANRMAQQQALDRQTATAEQALKVSQAGEAREAAKAPFIQTKTEADATAAQMDRDSKAASVLKNDLGMVESGNINAAAAWRARAAQLLPDWAAYLPSAEKIAGDRQTQLMLAGTVEQIINKSIPTPSTVLNFAPGGRAFAITTGGVNAPRADEVTTGSMAGAPPVAPTPMTMPPAAGVQPMAAPQTPTGGMFQRMSATGGQPQGAASQGADPLAPLLASMNEAKETKGQLGADVVEQLRQLDPRVTPDVIDAFLAQNGIKVAPGGGMRSAVYRPDGNAMAPQQIANRVGTQYIGRDPTQSPTASAPGIYNVPAPQIAGAAAAEAGGKASVNVVAEPKIVAGTERVKRLEKLRGDQPLALSDAQTLVADMDQKIKAIDEFLVNPNRNSIIGSIEGRIPNALQGERRATVQALYDSIVSNQVLNELIKGRQATETGASPMGIVSDRDLAVAAAASNRLTQTGDERAQDREMQRLRDVLYNTRQRALQAYNTTYREVAKDAPELRLTVEPIAEKYTKPAPKTARKTPVSTLTKPLRFNPATGDFE